jgi:type IV pilus assembly protein PilA
MKKTLQNQKGFTLIELMIVVAIIGILAAVAIPQYQNFTRKSKASEAKVILDAIITSEGAYFAEQDTVTNNKTNIGNPDGPGEYFTYALTTVNATNVRAVATPNTTAGVNAGLVSTWAMTYNGSTGVKGTQFPPQGW